MNLYTSFVACSSSVSCPTVFSTVTVLFGFSATLNEISVFSLYLPSVPFASVNSLIPFSVSSTVNVNSFAFTVSAFVSSWKLPLLIVTGLLLSLNDKTASFNGLVVISFALKSLSATSFSIPLLSVNVTTSPASDSFSPSV